MIDNEAVLEARAERINEAWDKYDREVTPVLQAYDDEMRQIRAAYKEARDAALATLDRVLAPARAARDEVLDKAQHWNEGWDKG